ncbi:MAG: ATP-binding cassette domain-containing protein [Verrucomicrobiae bacterium]|nr:ATP-binding cassette domain-containing protein [Verrucomicrobiae bacterium]
MLELRDLSFTINKDGEDVPLIDKASLKVPAGHFMAIVGPSGCGKSTLLKLIAGINVESEGNLFWNGRDLSTEGDLEPAEIGYVPQFGIAYDQLTVEESIESAVRLRVKTRGRQAFHGLVDRVLEQTGLDPLRHRPVRVLSGGQKRRLALAMELVTDPVLLLADEVTSGLDPKSEEEIVRLMHALSRKHHRIVVNVTHSLANLDLYDSVLVLHEGRVVYHGQPRALDHYFSVDEVEDIYPRLSKRSAEAWNSSWEKHRDDYYQALDSASKALEVEQEEVDATVDDSPDLTKSAATPGFIAQFFALFFRRCRIFARDGGQLFLQIAILLGFPVLVILFALNGVGETRSLSDRLPTTLEEYQQEKEIVEHNLNLGGLVSGLVMFQVILLALMASNNAAREIAAERLIFEKEKLGGVRPSTYLLSKLAFLGMLVVIQSVWMAVFVQNICHIPTVQFMPQMLLLLLANAAMTSICLGISSMAKTADQASLLSIYLVGFQLPLSGAVLALPSVAGWITRPFISAYWSWAGIMNSLEGSFRSAVDKVTDTWLAPSWICYAVLIVHIVIGLFFAYVGVKKSRWE